MNMNRGDKMRANTIKIFNMSDSLMNFYNEMAISPVGLLKNYALNLINSKVHKYEAEDSCFTKKYNCTFQEFEYKVALMENEEIF